MVWATGLLWKAWPLWIGNPRSTAYRAFLASLIEDFADEWLTKAMFHYRWAYDGDIQYASLWIADDCFPAQKGAARAATVLEAFTAAACPCHPNTTVLYALQSHCMLNHLYCFVGKGEQRLCCPAWAFGA